MTFEEEVAQVRTKILTYLDAAERALEAAKADGDAEAESKAQSDFDKATEAYEEFSKYVEEDFANKINGLVNDLRAIMEKYNYT